MTPEQEKQYEKVLNKLVDDILNQDVHPKGKKLKSKFPPGGWIPYEILEQSDQVTVIE